MRIDVGTRATRGATMVFAAMAALVWAGWMDSARAGFDWPEMKADGSAVLTDAQLTHDGEPFGQAGSPPQGTIDKIIDQFDLMDDDPTDPDGMTADEKARAKIAAMRENVVEGIALVKKQNSDVGDCLETLFRQDRICIDFKSAMADGTILHDGSTDCNGDRINIRVDQIPCTVVKCYDPDIYELYSILLHEGLHAIQDWNPPDEGDPARNRAADILRNACNERDAEQADVDAICELIPLLEMIENGMSPDNDDPKSMAECIAMKLWNDLHNSDDPMPAMDAARRLREKIEEVKMERQAIIDQWVIEKEATQQFLDGAISKMTMDDLVDNSATIAETIRRALDVLRRIRLWATASSGVLHQSSLDTETGETTVANVPTTLDSIHSALLLGPDSDRIMLAGMRFGQPAIIGLSDMDGDGLFDPESEIDLHVGFPFAGPIVLQDEKSMPAVLALDRSSGMIHRIIDTTGDGFPNQPLEPVAPPLPPDLHAQSILVPDAGGVIYAFRKKLSRVPAIGLGDQVVALVDQFGDGFYDLLIPSDPYQLACFPPTLQEPILPDQLLLPVHAMNDGLVEVFIADENGAPAELVAVGATDSAGFGAAELFEPGILSPGLPLVPVWPDSGKIGPVATVESAPCPANLNGDGVVDSADLALMLGSWGPAPAGAVADLNMNGFVGSDDLSILLGSWGPCP